MTDARQTTVRFSEEVYARLEQAGEVTGLPLNSIVTVACMEWLDRHLAPAGDALAPAGAGGWLRRIWPRGRGLVSGFTPSARGALTRAADEARRLDHGIIDVEHLLLSLLADRESQAAQVLAELGVTYQRAREQVKRLAPADPFPAMGEIGLTDRARKVIELSLAEARRLKQRSIGTEHLLLGIAREGESVAAQALEALGASLAAVRSATECRLRPRD